MQNFPMNQMPQGQSVQQGGMDAGLYQQQLHDLCQRYHHHLMQFETTDGQVHDGIIDGIDQNGVNMLMPVGDMDHDDTTDYRYGGYGGFPGGGYGYGYGFPRRFRRFRRRYFPFPILRSFFFPFFY